MLIRSVELKGLAVLDVSKLSCKKDIISFASSFEPLSNDFLAVVIVAYLWLASIWMQSDFGTYSALSQNVAPAS
jgi:hypothetical protein